MVWVPGKKPSYVRQRVESAGGANRRGRRLSSAVRDLSLPSAVALTILGLVATAILVLWLTGRPEGGDWWEFHPKPLEWKDRLTIAGAVAAGAGAAIALVVSYRKQRDVEHGRFAEAFAVATRQLGDDAPEVRIAGAYALAALADRHTPHRQQCIDALCAYLRLRYTPEADKQNLTSSTQSRILADGGTSSNTVTYRTGDREVRLSIIRIIRAHLQDQDAPTAWCGYNLDFTGATFDGGDFSGSTFSGGSVSFRGATFAEGTVSFSGAIFSTNTVSFSDAQFAGANVAFNRSAFPDGGVSFHSAAISAGTIMFHEARFTGALVSFFQSTMSGGDISFMRAEFTGSEVYFGHSMLSGTSISFVDAEFSGGSTKFDWATFSSGKVRFRGARFSGGELTFDGANLRECEISFRGAKFSGGQVTKDGEPFRGSRVAG